VEYDIGREDKRDAARAALDALAVDRERLATAATAPAVWYYVSSAAAVAAIVASPATGSAFWVTMIAALMAIVLSYIEPAHRKQTGLTIRRTAGPRSTTVITVVGILFVAGFGASVALASTGLVEWIVASTGTAFLATLLGLRWYDRVYGQELRVGF